MSTTLNIANGQSRNTATGPIAGLRARLKAWRIYRQTHDELMGLSDRELTDLGLPRSAIDATARAAAYGQK